jgi:type II secretory pathway pseudopilin PulG
MELIAVVSIIGIIAAVALTRFSGSADEAKSSTCHLNKHNIEVQTQLWFRNKGRLPNANLGDIGIDTNYFPDGLSKCPVDQSSYAIDSSGRIVGHTH